MSELSAQQIVNSVFTNTNKSSMTTYCIYTADDVFPDSFTYEVETMRLVSCLKQINQRMPKWVENECKYGYRILGIKADSHIWQHSNCQIQGNTLVLAPATRGTWLACQEEEANPGFWVTGLTYLHSSPSQHLSSLHFPPLVKWMSRSPSIKLIFTNGYFSITCECFLPPSSDNKFIYTTKLRPSVNGQ